MNRLFSKRKQQFIWCKVNAEKEFIPAQRIQRKPTSWLRTNNLAVFRIQMHHDDERQSQNCSLRSNKSSLLSRTIEPLSSWTVASCISVHICLKDVDYAGRTASCLIVQTTHPTFSFPPERNCFTLPTMLTMTGFYLEVDRCKVDNI